MKFKDHLKEMLKDPEFKKEYDALGPSEYLDDINDLFPFIPRGQYKRVKDFKPEA